MYKVLKLARHNFATDGGGSMIPMVSLLTLAPCRAQFDNADLRKNE
ncbi:hypothetical protein HMPREF9554_02744 [Treponema phagedenis F0421]|nr:hypothetical protein HMPREF9554_02744 [Treponema phagedenis F0421]